MLVTLKADITFHAEKPLSYPKNDWYDEITDNIILGLQDYYPGEVTAEIIDIDMFDETDEEQFEIEWD